MTLTIKELKRVHVIQEINVGWMTAKVVAEILSLSIWQVHRLVKKQREHGDAALAHGNRWRILSCLLVQYPLLPSLLLLPIGLLIYLYPGLFLTLAIGRRDLIGATQPRLMMSIRFVSSAFSVPDPSTSSTKPWSTSSRWSISQA